MSRKETPEVLLGEEAGQGEDRPGVLSRLTALVLAKVIGIYSAAAVGLISFFVLASDASRAEKALIKMAGDRQPGGR